MAFSLDSFSTEILLKIFKYLDIYDLCRLKQTCKRFNEIIEKWGNTINRDVKPLVTNQTHQIIIDRSYRLLTLFERLRISKNWKKGIYQEKSSLYSKTKFIPWLHLDKDLLWISRGRFLQAYERSKGGIFTRNVVYTIEGQNRADICRFVKKGELILSGQTDGSIRLWSVKDQKFIFDLLWCHNVDVSAVDMTDEIIVSGSRDNWVKLWSKTELDLQETQPPLLKEIDLDDRVWSVRLSEENKSLLAIGTAGVAYNSTVTIFDIINQATLMKLNPYMWGAGVLDLKWENKSTLWSCGYDSYIRRWDLRTGKCEQILKDPCGATVYCFQYDFFNTIISGTQSNGRAVLWDVRQDNYVQMYFMNCCQQRHKSSPIYSLSFDADFLFTATDQHVNILNFSVFSGNAKDYSNLFLKFIID